MNSHLARNHASEPAVAEILKLPLNKMCAEYRKLTRLGNFRYNLGVLKSGNKNLLVTVVRRPSNNETEFLPCPACYGFYQKKFLWGHHIGCSWRLEGKQTGTQNGNENYVKSVLAESQCMLGVLTQPTCRLAREKILPAMDKRDAVFHALSMDPLILVFGNFSLTLDPIGAKTQKRYSSLKSLLNPFKLYLNFLLSGPDKSTVLDF